ncbi:MAG: carboxypeptidase-like regulatory domain-containing protein [Gemmatimonadota bacterium]
MNASSIVGSAVVVAALLFVPQPATAQLVAGRTVDAEDSTAVGGAEIQLLDSLGTVVRRGLADAAGIFVLPVAPGVYTLRATRIGYAPVERPRVEVHGSERVTVEVRMSVRAVALDSIVVVGRVSNLRQRDLNEYFARAERDDSVDIGIIYRRTDLEPMDTWRFEDFMRREAPPVASRGRHFTCRPRVFWDGSERPVDPLLSVSSFQGVEFYRGFGPPGSRFVNPDGCGVILVWSRPLTADPRAHPTSRSRFLVAGALAAAILALKIF